MTGCINDKPGSPLVSAHPTLSAPRRKHTATQPQRRPVKPTRFPTRGGPAVTIGPDAPPYDETTIRTERPQRGER